MVEKNRITKTFIIIKNNKFLRVISLLNLLLIFSVIALCVTNCSYNDKIKVNLEQIETDKQLAQSLEETVQAKEAAPAEESITTKSFAKYEEVIPFVAILEQLFSAIDENSEIGLKSKENEMYTNHYADYKVSLKINNKPLFFQVFNELYESKFITDVIGFSISYLPESEGEISKLNQAELTIRLYLD